MADETAFRLWVYFWVYLIFLAMDVNQSGGYEADYVAHEIVNGIALEDEDLVIAKLSHSAIAALRHITPSIVHSLKGSNQIL